MTQVNAMAHINHSRQLLQYGHYSLDGFLPRDREGDSFAAFCGTADQRMAVAVRGMVRAAGYRGIVYLHNDPRNYGALLDRLIRQFRTSNPSHPDLPVIDVNPPGRGEYYYDPLYGLDEENVLNCIASAAGSGPASQGASGLRARLSDYLYIARTLSQTAPGVFGTHPYNLDFLLELTEMSYETLDRLVLGGMAVDESQRRRIRRTLSAEGAALAAADAVRTFASSLDGRLWTRRRFQQHTRHSIVSAVRRRSVISICLPTPHSGLLDYLDAELDTLLRNSDPFLLVADEAVLRDSRLRERFLNYHAQAGYSTGLLASSLSVITTNYAEDLGRLLSTHQQTAVFAAPNAAVAEPFSAACGTYFRIVRELHSEHHREWLKIFPGHSWGVSHHESEQRTVRPDDLVSLDSGALLFLEGISIPMLTRYFEL